MAEEKGEQNVTTVGPKFIKYWQDKGKNYMDNMPDVFIKVKIYEISEIDTVDLKVTVDFVVALDWIDPSIEGCGHTCADTGFDVTDHFCPVVVLNNAVNVGNCVSIGGPQPTRIQEGREHMFHVKRTERYREQIRVDMDFRTYPFDHQSIMLRFIVLTHGRLRKTLRLRASLDEPHAMAEYNELFEKNAIGDAACGMSPRLTPFHEVNAASDKKEWEIYAIARGSKTASGFYDSQYAVDVACKRRPEVLIYTLFLPLTFITMFAFCSFIGSSAGESAELRLNRISVVVTLLLAVIGFQQYALSKLPTLPYLTLADTYIYRSTVFLLLVAALHVVGSNGAAGISFQSLMSFENVSSLQVMFSSPDGFNNLPLLLLTISWLYIQWSFYVHVVSRGTTAAASLSECAGCRKFSKQELKIRTVNAELVKKLEAAEKAREDVLKKRRDAALVSSQEGKKKDV